MKISSYRKLLLCSILCFVVSSFSFLIIPVSDFEGSIIEKVMAYMVGVLFWTGLISGLILTFLLGKIRKKETENKNKRLGMTYFFRNKKAKKCDIAMIVFIILFIVFHSILGLNNWITIILLSLAFLSVYLHSVLNGNNYAYAVKRGVKK